VTAPEASSELPRALSLFFARWPQVRLVLLFGSRATGKNAVDSDLDLAIDAPKDDLDPIAGALSAELGLEVDVIPVADVTIPLLEALVRDGVVVHEGKRGAAASWRTKALIDLETDRPWYARTRDAWLRRVADKGL
jgi:predicted nucleotidyltransferase